MTSPILTAKSDRRQPVRQQVLIDETALVIFDSRVKDLPLLLAALRPGITAHVLDPDRDGIEQISQLIQYRPTPSLTLVAHGAPGELQLGAGRLELGNLEQYAPHLRSWFRPTDAAQLNLLACNVAAGDAGLEFVEELSALTGTTVTAATTVVGNGQWPPIAAQTFQLDVLEQYTATLVLTFKEDIKDGTFDGGDPDSNRLFGASGVAISPDGSQLFVTSAVESALTVFDRDEFGNITFRQTIRDGSNVGAILGSELLAGAFGVAVSPDGTQVFVTSVGDDGLTVFNRDSAGNLTEQQRLRDGRRDPNDNDINTLAGAIDVAVSADGTQVFVVSLTDGAITVFDRDGSGTLTLRQSIADGQGGANELFGASGVAISPTGDQVFVTSHVDAAITVFDRDGSGNLTFRQTLKDGVGDVQDLFGASSVDVSPDGKQVYVASATDAALTVFDRNADGTLSFAQVIRDNEGGAQLFGGANDIFAGTGVSGFPAINGFSSVTVSPDGRQVLVAGFEENGLTVFDRDASGRLTFSQFIQDQDGNGADELAGTLGVVVSPDDQQVFVTGFEDGAITAFNRDLAPSLLSITRQTPTTANTDADSLVFRLTFDQSILNIDPADFRVTGGSTAAVTNVSAVSATVYDITVSGGNLAGFNGTVGLDLAASQNITDPVGNHLPTAEPATDETYTLTNTVVPTNPAKLTPLAGLEVTGLGAGNTVRLQVDQVNLGAMGQIGEILIFSVDSTSRTQIGSFSILEGGQLPDDYAPAFSIDNGQVTEGQFLEFELVVNGVTRLATPTAVSDTQISLDFGAGTQLTAQIFTQTATTNLLVGDATAIDLTGQTGVVNVEFTVYRAAARDNTVGFYTTDFANGGIRDPLTGNSLLPGDTGYKEAALANQLEVQLSGENGQVNTFSAALTGGGFLGIFLVAEGSDPTTGEVFFSHAGANGGNRDHAKLLGDNAFGFEDLGGLGDRDFNDMVVEFAIG
ncbi:DUF4347 domain-containing protein [Leptothoe sp. PORK10 BA2]|uniref:DUF4347 domain-containing protein n=1 Tax=Leptothoe sp. PORK10 BA2 TaxID=3110254 RepID=UPI002B21C124|nr:DUF4347 domain-containing protein [Leptothoe sp. PORK10 BA2]MEA5466311.1 DUF4347 domain-containing protein [Leptothoe sp. PORK10 BA2]